MKRIFEEYCKLKLGLHRSHRIALRPVESKMMVSGGLRLA